jgi:hypothetical protein
MGMLRAICPSSEFPEVRLRFYAPKGHAYAPKDFAERVRTGGKSKNPIVQLLNRASTWVPKNQIWRETLPLLKGRCILNQDAAWPQYKLLSYGELGMALLRLLAHPAATIALLRASDTQLSELLRFAAGPRADVGKLPPGLSASWIGAGCVLSSLGIVDDLRDGIITCRLKGIDKPAKARIVVCPPHFSPDRRPPVSLADDLADKEDRAAPRDPLWVSGDGWLSAQMEIDDLLDRAFETTGASNLDVWAEQRREENESAAVYRGDQHKPKAPGAPIWQNLRELTVMDLPLYQQGVWRHRRNSADEFFEQLIRDDANSPDAENLVATWIRNRDDPLSVYYDKKMPALMRGSAADAFDARHRHSKPGFDASAPDRWKKKERDGPSASPT